MFYEIKNFSLLQEIIKNQPMKILSLTEDQHQLLKNQYEDELELALKYVDDIKSILFKLNKQETKPGKEKKTRKTRKTRKAKLVKSAVSATEPVSKVSAAKKKPGRKAKDVKDKPEPKKNAAKVKTKAAPVKRSPVKTYINPEVKKEG